MDWQRLMSRGHVFWELATRRWTTESGSKVAPGNAKTIRKREQEDRFRLYHWSKLNSEMNSIPASNNMSCATVTSNNSADGNITGDKVLYEDVYHVLYTYGLPTICICGFLGNVMNLVILAGKRIQTQLRSAERSVNIGLIALAVADLSFCISAFPSTFLPEDGVFSEKGFLTYYGCYCAAVINIFIMTSTWLTVTMSSERYLAIRHPLKSRNIITLERSKFVIVLVYILSAIFNIPVFWRYAITELHCDSELKYQIMPQVINENFDHAYRAMWAALGNFIPLVILLFCNIGLMREIHKSYAMRKQMNGNAGIHANHASDKEANRITITLVAIVVMFFMLVAPSEVMKQVAYLVGGDLSKNYTYLIIEVIYNLLQTINFSANFILYCIINPSFRKTMKEMFCFQYQKLSSDVFETSFMDSTYQDRFSSSLRMNSLRKSKKLSMGVRHEYVRADSENVPL
ncbi:hypothetical protein CAPTEDRAFT_208773 [Capitella teleta]|uniref:G-protein coupled receptors family 1 profile domain-containing protein n=1 Tax=Capitella teleta TaxID=283909 RepID=R7TXG0_CAPTE|nr:hypothetical protein CAPTEDRAFT_208773 [Capitella teleta]|eukprot:ELT96131.1 hypothetical protein CAPTEDRAFT_208773 [Capitella teleta]